MFTPASSARSIVRRIVSASPACPPHAMFADVISAINRASCEQPSPRSQLRSTCSIPEEFTTHAEYAQLTFELSSQRLRFDKRDQMKGELVARPKLRDQW